MEKHKYLSDQDKRLMLTVEEKVSSGWRICGPIHQRRDMAVGEARVTMLMNTLDLEAIQPSFFPNPTQSQPPLSCSPKLLVDRVPPVQINEVLIANLTNIPLQTRRFASR
ncbi:MAG: hypothetical protein KDA93_15225 [Planctomycetaceae bacterium]|nr:hypothetical protein [Planctomycetaceae bacterium]